MMNTYRIINITNLFGKREPKYNSTVSIEYVDGMESKTIKLLPGKTLYLTLNKLPLSIRNLIVTNVVDVTTIPENQLKKLMNPKPIPTVPEDVTSNDNSYNRKKINKIKTAE